VLLLVLPLVPHLPLETADRLAWAAWTQAAPPGRHQPSSCELLALMTMTTSQLHCALNLVGQQGSPSAARLTACRWS
jgi:hypothetical protein